MGPSAPGVSVGGGIVATVRECHPKPLLLKSGIDFDLSAALDAGPSGNTHTQQAKTIATAVAFNPGCAVKGRTDFVMVMFPDS